MLRCLSLLAVSMVLLFSCSDQYKEIGIDDDDRKEDPPISLPLMLQVDRNTAGIYDMLVFTLKDSTYQGPNELIYIPLTYSDLDSLIWEVEGTAKKVNLLNRNNGGFSFTAEWGHYFYLPGRYKAFLSGYKANKRVVRDSVHIDIAAQADFLNVNWNTVQNLNQNTGYTNNGTLNHQFQLLNRVKDHVLFSSLTVTFDSIDYMKINPGVDVKEKELLSSYITQLYGNPQYQDNDDILNEQFKQLFKSTIPKDKVLKIWKTKRSNIALLYMKHEEGGSPFQYWVHAEPAK